MSAKSPTAYWPLPSLLRSLSRAGWGPLAGREYQGIRSTLTALSNRLPDRSAEGLSTAEQIAASAGLSERWVRRCLNVLEDLGIITWQRGGVIDGRPAPSMFTVIKHRLVTLINKARGIRTEVETAHREKTRKRITDAGLNYTMRPRRKKKTAKSSGSAHAELSASLSTPIGGMPPRGNSHPREKDQKMAIERIDVMPDQELELRQAAQQMRLAEQQRLVAVEMETGARVRQQIRDHRASMGEDTDYKTATKDYILARFGKGKR